MMSFISVLYFIIVLQYLSDTLSIRFSAIDISFLMCDYDWVIKKIKDPSSYPTLSYYTGADYETIRFSMLCKLLCYLSLVLLL